MRQLLSVSIMSLALAASGRAHAQEASESPAVDQASADKSSEDKAPLASKPSDATNDTAKGASGDSSKEAPATEAPSAPKPAGPTLTEQEAREAFRLGDRLYLEGDYAGAIKSFERAYSLSGRIEMLFNLANAHERLGSYDRASVALRGYIPHSPPEHRPALERRLERFEQLASKAQERKKETAQKVIELKEKEKETAEVVKELKENPRPFPIERGLGIGFLTLGSAGVATGVGFAISASRARKMLDENCVEGQNGRLCTEDMDSALNRDKTHSVVADVAVVAGAALAGTGVYLLFRARQKEREDVELRVGVGPRSVMLQGSF